MKKTVFLLMLFISTITQAQTVPKQSRLAITQNVKQNSATRIVVQDSITKELNWVLKSNLNPTLDNVLAAGNTSTKSLALTNPTSFVTVSLGASQSPLSFSRNQASAGFTLGNPQVSQPYSINSTNYFGTSYVAGSSENTISAMAEHSFNIGNSIGDGITSGIFRIGKTRVQSIVPIKYSSNVSFVFDEKTLVDKQFVDNAISGSTSYLSKFTGPNIIRPSSWRETSVGSRLFNATDDGFTTFQLTGSASISNTLKSSSNYSTALTGTATFGTGVQATSNGFADGLLAVSTNGVAGDFDIQSSINGNESNIAEFKDNGVVQASISDVGLATVNGLVSNDKITTSSSIKIGDDTSPANQYTAGTFRYRSLGEVGFPEVVTQDSFGNYNWRTLYHSGNLNLNNYLRTTGGTLTGALNGTSANFTGQVEALNSNFKTNQQLILTGTGGGLIAPNNGNISFVCNNPASPGWSSNTHISSTGNITALALQQTGTGFSLGYSNMQLNTSSRFLWSSDGSFSGSKDTGIARTAAGQLSIMDGATNANLRDLRLRTLFATGLNVTAGTAPASSTATGTAGEIRITSTFIYYCTATNVWVRSALTTW